MSNFILTTSLNMFDSMIRQLEAETWLVAEIVASARLASPIWVCNSFAGDRPKGQNEGTNRLEQVPINVGISGPI
jgi:hypothetical protein